MTPRRQIFSWIIFLACFLAGCAVAGSVVGKMDERPDDFQLVYSWQEGSLPPPYHYEVEVTLAPSGVGEMRLTPDYAGEGVPVFSEAFTVSVAKLDELYRLLQEQGLLTERWRALDDPPVGGSSEWLEVTAGGRSIEIPAYLPEGQAAKAGVMIAAIRALVPAAAWERLEAERRQYWQERSEEVSP